MSQTILFDIETTAIPKTGVQDIKTIHCIAAFCLETERKYFAVSTKEIRKLLSVLQKATTLVAHNAIGFDIPILKNLFSNFKPQGYIFDTLVMCRALWHDISLKDFKRCRSGTFPRRLVGNHSLEAYGYRLGEYKGDYCKKEDAWEVYTEEMKEYCIQDVVVLTKLYKKILRAKPSSKMLDIENKFAEIMFQQGQRGVYFDKHRAIFLMGDLYARKQQLFNELQNLYPPAYVPVDFGKTFVAARANKNLPGLRKGSEYCKIKLEKFNPGSRQQIATKLKNKYGWAPTVRTEKGTVQINEKILKELPYPEIELLVEYFIVDKRLSQIVNGTHGWMKHVRDDSKIYGLINTGGTISGRCSHSRPNLAQVPNMGSAYGAECRELFTASPNYLLVGCDASGLELRCLAHYLAAFDNGEYADLILNGDIHTANQRAARLPERSMAKTFIYGWLYGAGAAKLGQIVKGGAKEGAKLQKSFMSKFPAIKKLKQEVELKVKEYGYIKGLDGRHLRTRSPHSALNLLLQSAGAILMKRAVIELALLTEQLDKHFVLNIHDEIQVEVIPDHVDMFTIACHEAFKRTAKYFNFRMPLECEVKVGNNWKDTH